MFSWCPPDAEGQAVISNRTGVPLATVPSLSNQNTVESCLNSPDTAPELGTDFGTHLK